MKLRIETLRIAHNACCNFCDVPSEDFVLQVILPHGQRWTVPRDYEIQPFKYISHRDCTVPTRPILSSFVSSCKADVFKCHSIDEATYSTIPYTCSYSNGEYFKLSSSGPCSKAIRLVLAVDLTDSLLSFNQPQNKVARLI